jgi:muramoyltetrapeptide carboxypeptidase LdcA involved in peptidoglycan recycling
VTNELIAPPKVLAGDQVAVLSPSWAGAALFPEVHELSMRVIRDDLGLIPVQFPTTLDMTASPEARASDLMNAFAEPSIRAVLTTIGGDDEITVLPFLDPDVVQANPKAFFGYSDNTNVLNWLWNLGIASYHGGSTLIHLARRGGVHPVSIESLRRALFVSGTYAIEPQGDFTDEHRGWDEYSDMTQALPMFRDPGWDWHNATRVVSGPTWGGNLEIMHWNLAAGRWILPVERYDGCVLILETSEEMPPADEVFRMLRNAGERGLLERFGALVMAKPKAWHPLRPLNVDERARFRADQRDAVLQAFDYYNPSAMIVFGPDFGHTDPQYVLPFGGVMTVDGPGRRITVDY